MLSRLLSRLNPYRPSFSALRGASLLGLLWLSSKLALTVAKAESAPPSAATVSLEREIQIDEILLPQLSPQALDLVREDLRRFQTLQFRAPSAGPFSKFFRGKSQESIVSYLLGRVRYIGVEPSERPSSIARPALRGANSPWTTQPDGNGADYATNYGPSGLLFFYHNEILGEANAQPERLAFRNSFVEIRSPRTGFIALGSAYVDPSSTLIDRLDTWVHEARHSDCPKIPSEKDLHRLDQGHYSNLTQYGRACTHIHLPCPKNHELAGELACDAHPWGAYSIGYLYSSTLAQRCETCSEKERQAAIAAAAEDFNRLPEWLQNWWENDQLPDPSHGDAFLLPAMR